MDNTNPVGWCLYRLANKTFKLNPIVKVLLTEPSPISLQGFIVNAEYCSNLCKVAAQTGR